MFDMSGVVSKRG